MIAGNSLCKKLFICIHADNLIYRITEILPGKSRQPFVNEDYQIKK